MDQYFNISQKFIQIKDISPIFDFVALNEHLIDLEYNKNISNKISKDLFLLDRENLVNSKNAITVVVENYLRDAIGIKDYFTNLNITNSWANKTSSNEAHHDHVHPFSIVSGVIFLEDNVDNLNLYIEAYSPDIPYFITKNKSYVALKNLLKDHNIDPISCNNLKHHMVLFLSNCHHFVENIPENRPERVTISFNTFWKGTTGVKTANLGNYNFT